MATIVVWMVGRWVAAKIVSWMSGRWVPGENRCLEGGTPVVAKIVSWMSGRRVMAKIAVWMVGRRVLAKIVSWMLEVVLGGILDGFRVENGANDEAGRPGSCERAGKGEPKDATMTTVMIGALRRRHLHFPPFFFVLMFIASLKTVRRME